MARTPLYQQHVEADGKIVDFAGWEMPIHYGSQIEEHHAVRQGVGVFDVSHMAIVDITGDDSTPFLQYLLANDVARLTTQGKALYSALLNHQGGIIDDLIVYRMDFGYRLVVNAGTRDKDIQWLQEQATTFKVAITKRQDLAMLAIQGPQAMAKLLQIAPDSHKNDIEKLKYFFGQAMDDWFVARTGYTGEDGFEVMVPNDQVCQFWQDLINVGVKPCGLGARDTLRLEAGMNLYGSDMDESVSPLVSNMEWTIAWEPHERQFIGRDSLEKERELGISRQLVGLVLKKGGVLRAHQKVILEQGGEGTVTSGSFSPTLGHAIALARIPCTDVKHCLVDIRGKLLAVDIVQPPFVRHGKKVF